MTPLLLLTSVSKSVDQRRPRNARKGAQRAAQLVLHPPAQHIRAGFQKLQQWTKKAQFREKTDLEYKECERHGIQDDQPVPGRPCT